jgi:hypothetical protein
MPVNKRVTQRKGSKTKRNTRRIGRRVGGVSLLTKTVLATTAAAAAAGKAAKSGLNAMEESSKIVVDAIASGVMTVGSPIAHNHSGAHEPHGHDEHSTHNIGAHAGPTVHTFNASTTVAVPDYLNSSPFVGPSNYFIGSVVPPAARVDISKYKEEGTGPAWIPSTLHGQPVPNSLKNRFSQPVGSNVEHRKGNLTPTEAYARPVWQKPGEDYKVTWGVNPVAGSRFISEPEVQTWMPYVTGNPDEKVDYFEGYSAVDKAALIDTFYTKKGLDAPGQVERRFTPMYIFASIMAVDLPEYRPDQKELSDSRYEAWAERCKAGGMRAIPLKDPRSLPADEKPAVGAHFPEYVPKGMLLNQLVAHGRAPLDYITSTLKRAINSTSMRTGFVSLPAEIWWTGSTASTVSTPSS